MHSCLTRSPVYLCIIALIGCSQTTGGGGQNSAPPTPTVPQVQISEISPGKANIKILTQGTAQDLFNIRACELGKFAQGKNATHIKTPDRTEVTTKVAGGNATVSVDQDFEYFGASDTAPEGSNEAAKLLEKCVA